MSAARLFTYVFDAQTNHLNEMVLLSTHNRYMKISFNYTLFYLVACELLIYSGVPPVPVYVISLLYIILFFIIPHVNSPRRTTDIL